MTDIWEFDGKQHVPIDVRKLVVKDGVKFLSRYSFMDYTQLVSVEIPDSVKRIEASAFKGCKSLHSVSMPGVESLGYCAFEGCSQLVSIDIPNSMTSIQESVFEDCRSLQSINLAGVKSIHQRAFMHCTKLRSVDIPDSVTQIGSSAFSGCSSLQYISMPNVKSIDVCAFKDCSKLISVDITDSITEIGSSAFDGCSSLQTIHFSPNIEIIGSCTFRGCKSLTSVNLLHLSLLTTIGERAFYKCTALKSIQFPSSLKHIRKEAFFGCSSLTTLKFSPSIDSMDAGCFDMCPLTSLCLPLGSCVTKYDGQILPLKSIQFYSSLDNRTPHLQDFLFLVIMIKRSPTAAQRPCTDHGVLPLHFSLMHGFAYEIENITTILKAAPDVLNVRDTVHHMYPFLLAAWSPTPDSCSYFDFTRNIRKLQCIYMLLREEPHVMSFLINNIMSSRA